MHFICLSGGFVTNHKQHKNYTKLRAVFRIGRQTITEEIGACTVKRIATGARYPNLVFELAKRPPLLWRDSLRRIPPIGFFLSRSDGLVHAEGAPTRFMVASGGVLSEGYGHCGPGVCLAMARRRPKEYRKVDAATRCPHT